MENIEKLTKQVKAMSKSIKKEIKRVKVNPEIRAALTLKNQEIEKTFEEALAEVNKSLSVIFAEVGQLKTNLLDVLHKNLSEQANHPVFVNTDKPAKPTAAPKPVKEEKPKAKKSPKDLQAGIQAALTGEKKSAKPQAKKPVAKKPAAKPVKKAVKPAVAPKASDA